MRTEEFVHIRRWRDMLCKACGEETDVGDDGLCDYCRDLFRDFKMGDDDDGEAD